MRKFIHILLLPLLFLSSALSGDEKKTICLNMIVKNESKAIIRCLASVKDRIDYWVISDTGSDDGTQDIIRAYLKGIPGELHEHPWKDFAHNRNLALEAAKGKADYLLHIDADEQLIYDNTFNGFELDKDCYFAIVREANGTDYQRILLTNNHLSWKWKGVLHENLECEGGQTAALVKGAINYSDTKDGHRSSDPNKYKKDAAILEAALVEEPNNSRYMFYLGQSYANANDYAAALKAYEKRIEMGGWDQEVFWSQFSVAKLQHFLKMPKETVIKSLWKAYEIRPTRAEPLYQLIAYYLEEKNYHLAYLVAKQAVSLPLPLDLVFVEQWVYDWGASVQLANCAFFLKRYDEACEITNRLLSRPTLPPDTRQNLERNRELLESALAPAAAQNQ